MCEMCRQAYFALKGHSTATVMCNLITLISKRTPTATVMRNYSAVEGAANSNCHV